MGKHLVVLSAVVERYGEGQRIGTDGIHLSGWILRLHHQFFWVTAGHCLKALDKELAAGTLRLLESSFADYFGDNAKHSHNIPFTYEPGCGFYIDDDSQGLDFGIIPLSHLTVLNLIANGVKAVGRENWERQLGLSFEHYKMVGVPSHLTRFAVSPSGNFATEIQPVMIAIERLDPMTISNPLPADWFVGQIHPDVRIESIVGMSGGPIYGFRKSESGQWAYHVVALQSRWREAERIVFGCPVPVFAESLHQTLEQVIQDVQAAAPDVT